jgi:hypothetical protein
MISGNRDRCNIEIDKSSWPTTVKLMIGVLDSWYKTRQGKARQGRNNNGNID